MNRRFALAVATVEVLLTTALVAVAVRWWYRGMIVIEVAGAELFRVDGRWWAGAVLAVTVAGLLLIDAVRRLVLAFRRDRTEVEPADRSEPDLDAAGPDR